MHSNMSWCHLGGIVDTGKHYMVKHFLELEPSHSGRHVYIANGVMRSPGCNWIEVDNTVHAFLMEKDLWWEMFEKKSLWFQEWEMFLKWLLVVNTKKILKLQRQSRIDLHQCSENNSHYLQKLCSVDTNAKIKPRGKYIPMLLNQHIILEMHWLVLVKHCELAIMP